MNKKNLRTFQRHLKIENEQQKIFGVKRNVAVKKRGRNHNMGGGNINGNMWLTQINEFVMLKSVGLSMKLLDTDGFV